MSTWADLRTNWVTNETMSASEFNAYAARINAHSAAIDINTAALAGGMVVTVAGLTGIVTAGSLKTTLSLVKADVGLANVDNTSDATKWAANATVTNKDLTSGTNTFPTFNQNTTGSAATLGTSRTFQTNLASTSPAGFNGSANNSHGVTGTLPVGNGGTGATTLTGILVGNGTSAFTTVTAPSGALVGTTDPQSLGSKTLTNPTITGYTESVVAIGNTSTAKTISLSSGTVQTATLTGNCTFTLPTATAGLSFVLYLSTGAGGYTATFTGVKWPAGTAPTITPTASRMDILSFVADGTNWYGTYVQNFTP